MADGDLMPYDLIVVKDQTEKFEHIMEKDRIDITCKCEGEYAGVTLLAMRRLFVSHSKHYQDNKEEFDREFAQRRNDEMKQTSNKERVYSLNRIVNLLLRQA